MPVWDPKNGMWDFKGDPTNMQKRVDQIKAICKSRREGVITRYENLMKYQEANYGTPAPAKLTKGTCA